MEEVLKSLNAVIDVHGTPVRFENLDIRGGDFVLIKGRNGYGKSSFLKMLVGRDVAVRLTRGDISFPYLFQDKGMAHFSDNEKAKLRNSIAYVPQDDDFLPTYSIFSAIYTGLKQTVDFSSTIPHNQKAQKKKECKKMVEEYLKKFYEIGLFQDGGHNSIFKSPKLRSIYSCSGGQRKMCQIVNAIIQAKVLGSKLILMDEPLNNLDKNNKKILNNEIRDLLKMENPPAIMMVTHCHIFFGVNKEITIEDSKDGRVANFVSSGDNLFSSCLIEGNEKEGYYEIEKAL